eukprot:40186-Chlamydomonas_euryale.AAC.5
MTAHAPVLLHLILHPLAQTLTPNLPSPHPASPAAQRCLQMAGGAAHLASPLPAPDHICSPSPHPTPSITDDGIAALLEGGGMRRLTSLDASFCAGLGDIALRALPAGAPLLRALRVDGCCAATPAGIALAICGCRGLVNVSASCCRADVQTAAAEAAARRRQRSGGGNNGGSSSSSGSSRSSGSGSECRGVAGEWLHECRGAAGERLHEGEAGSVFIADDGHWWRPVKKAWWMA